jgi:hypothetical protein
LNVEVAHKLSEQEESEQRRKQRWEEIAEVIEVLILAIAAIATAWSGFQASKWDGRQSVLYGQSTRQRFLASDASTRGGQMLVADSAMFTGWLQARAAGDTQLEAIFVARFTPDYRQAFDEWLKTNPFHNSSAPPGPAYMPTYENPELVKAEQLNSDAEAKFEQGTKSGETADRYVRLTVLFALVLFLVAAGQRFKQRPVRIAANVLAFGLLIFTLVYVIILPRL